MKSDSPDKENSNVFFELAKMRTDRNYWKQEYDTLEKKYIELQIKYGKSQGLCKHYEVVIDDLKAEVALGQQNAKY